MKHMKIFAVALLAMMLLHSGQVRAQAPAKSKDFQAGKPLGSVNEAGKFTPMTSNVKVYGSFRFAESVTYDPARNLLVVMNAGNPQNLETNDGYVSLLNPDGTVHTAKWIGATRDGLTLNHPLGTAIQGGVLYTADIDTVRTFDLATGRPGREFPVAGAT